MLFGNFFCSCLPKLEEGVPLPSPSHLKRKIIIKNKKLKPEQESEGEYGTLVKIIKADV